MNDMHNILDAMSFEHIHKFRETKLDLFQGGSNANKCYLLQDFQPYDIGSMSQQITIVSKILNLPSNIEINEEMAT